MFEPHSWTMRGQKLASSEPELILSRNVKADCRSPQPDSRKSEYERKKATGSLVVFSQKVLHSSVLWPDFAAAS